MFYFLISFLWFLGMGKSRVCVSRTERKCVCTTQVQVEKLKQFESFLSNSGNVLNPAGGGGV